jgi:hypothetical protein
VWCHGGGGEPDRRANAFVDVRCIWKSCWRPRRARRGTLMLNLRGSHPCSEGRDGEGSWCWWADLTSTRDQAGAPRVGV